MSTTATVTTLEVSVQVIRIGTKQCTLAVFRQLDQEHYSPDLGTLWGRVSYCPEKCGRPCLSLVWSDGDELYREHIQRPDFGRPIAPGVYRPLPVPRFHDFPMCDIKRRFYQYRDAPEKMLNMTYAEVTERVSLNERRGLSDTDVDEGWVWKESLDRAIRGRKAWPDDQAKHRASWDHEMREHQFDLKLWDQWDAYSTLPLLFIAA